MGQNQHKVDLDVSDQQFEEKLVTEWNKKDLYDFFAAINFDPLCFKEFPDITNGKQLIEIINDRKKFHEEVVKIVDDRDRVVFKITCKNIKRRTNNEQPFHMGFFRVLMKLLTFLDTTMPLISKQKTSSIGLALSVGVKKGSKVKKRIKRTNSKVTYNKTLFKQFDKEFSVAGIEKKVNALSYREELRKTYEEELRKHFDEREGSLENRKYKFPAKIVITENIFSSTKKFIRKILSPIVNEIPSLKQDFGMFHAAVIIGPLYLEWNVMSIIQPKEMESQNALFVGDVDNIGIVKDKSIKEIADSLAKVVVKWNTKIFYTSIKSSESTGNCQEFVQNVLKEFDVYLPKSAFSEFFDHLKKKGKAELVFKYPEAFRKHFKLNEDSRVFKTHGELDEFVDELNEIDSSFDSNVKFAGEYRLLKSFDRAFWLRKYKIDEKKKDKELDEEAKEELDRFDRLYSPSKKGCPFKDPLLTQSILKN